MPHSPPPLSASAIKIIQRIVSAEAESDEDFAIVVGSGEDGRGGGGGAHERPLLSVFGDHAEVVVGEASERASEASLSTIDASVCRPPLCAYSSSSPSSQCRTCIWHLAAVLRRRSLSAAMPFIMDLLSQLSVSRGSKGGGGLAAINQIGNGQTL